MEQNQHPSERLRAARLESGFATATEACKHFGWKQPTYAGHENGLRGFKRKDAEKYADAFSVTPEWLLFGKRDRSFEQQPSVSRAFSEPDVTAFHPPTDRSRTALMHILDAFGTVARHPVSYRLNRHIPGLLLSSGDLAICDLYARPTSGQIVLVQVANEDTGEGETRLFLATDGEPIPPYGENQIPKNSRIAIIGTVVGVFRHTAAQ